MTPQTRLVLQQWPTYWVEWDFALDLLQRCLPWNRRAIANRASWLFRHGYIERDWMLSSHRDSEGNSPCFLLTRKAQ